MHVLDDHTASSCTGLPKAYGILGLFDETVTYFRSNGKLAENLSGISVEASKSGSSKAGGCLCKSLSISDGRKECIIFRREPFSVSNFCVN